MKIYDISIPYSTGMTQWPGSQPVKITSNSRIHKGDKYNESSFSINLHAGTHIDAPFHFINNGMTIDKIPLRHLTGNCYVTKKINSSQITPATLKSLKIPRTVDKILFKTRNSSLWQLNKFNKQYTALTPAGSKWLIKRKIQLIGIDYVSIGKFNRSNITTHKILLYKKVIIIEGLNLLAIKPGKYNIIAFPLNINGCESAPARVILIK